MNNTDVKKILITGGSGFIGNHLIRSLVKRGFSIRSLDISPAKHEFSEVNYIQGDIRNEICIKNSVLWADAVVHLASFGFGPICSENPGESYATNLFGTNLILDLCKDKIVDTGRNTRVLFASSSAVYGDEVSSIALHEECLLPSAKSLYSSQKKAAEEAFRLYYRLYGLNTMSLRLFNVFGHSHEGNRAGVINRFCSALESQSILQIYGDGGQTRDFIYIDDVVRAFYQALIAPRVNVQGQVINVGSGVSTSIKDLADILIHAYKEDPKIEYFPERIGDRRHSVANIARAKAALDWSPKYTLEEGLLRMLVRRQKYFKRAEVINAFG